MAKTILIVEDNALNMRLFNDLLKAHDFQIIQSTEGSDAIELASMHRPDLILMDIQLPGRSGIDITKDLKSDETLKHIPVIAVTAFAMRGDESLILEAGCDDYIPKPISIPNFLETIKKNLLKQR